ncbi:MAG: nucleoside-diphosphate kinase [Elusimicrobia bacterium]|nr:nucleoside-diphosphate kinase [Elusimicrobiota bacterium]
MKYSKLDFSEGRRLETDIVEVQINPAGDNLSGRSNFSYNMASGRNYMNVQQTLVLVKPDAIQRGVTGHIIHRLAHAHLRIVGAKVVKVTEALAREHYRSLSDKPFFEELVKYIRGQLHGEEYSGVLALVYQGEDVVKKVREIAGATNPEQAQPKSLRGAYGRVTSKGQIENIIHASSDPQDAEREIKLWFSPHELTHVIYPVKSAGQNGSKKWA